MLDLIFASIMEIEIEVSSFGHSFRKRHGRQSGFNQQTILAGAFDRTVAILIERRATLERAARLLLERETFDGPALKPFRDEMQPANALAAQ